MEGLLSTGPTPSRFIMSRVEVSRGGGSATKVYRKYFDINSLYFGKTSKYKSNAYIYYTILGVFKVLKVSS